MPDVRLDFIPTSEPGMNKLHIYEAPAQEGPFSKIETVTFPVGQPPSWHTTELATSKTNWFAIQWEDEKGATTDLSTPIMGGTDSVVANIVRRALLRDPNLDEEIVFQEAEAVAEEYFGGDLPETTSSRVLSGLTLWAMGRAKLFSLITSGSSSGWTAGLVSMKTDTSSGTNNLAGIRDLMKEAARMLGLSYSRVAQVKYPEIAYGLSEVVSADLSRLLIEVE